MLHGLADAKRPERVAAHTYHVVLSPERPGAIISVVGTVTYLAVCHERTQHYISRHTTCD